MNHVELQLDRLVGPTHHFGGLGVGNVASKRNAGNRSNPAAAAIQGLEKMRLIARWTGCQLIVPPQPRPDYQVLRNLGFTGSDQEVLKRARETAPDLLSAVTSCSAMWTANAATVSAGIDSAITNRSPRLTVANLVSSLHRATEPPSTEADLRNALPRSCIIDPPLAGGHAMRDEGAANHMRLGSCEAIPGIHIFVYGDGDPKPKRYAARQSLLACEAIARLHRIPQENVFYLKQHPDAIDAGAFHNDVVAMSHHDRFLYHEETFYEAESTLRSMDARYQTLYGRPLMRIPIASSSLSLNEAVQTYLFNSQIVTVEQDGPPRILCTRQVEQNPQTRQLVETWCNDRVFESCEFVDLNQSMAGGGGPACLRLRIPIQENFLDSIPTTSRFTEATYQRLREHVEDHYPTELTIDDLARIEFQNSVAESQRKIRLLLSAES